jgi:hypothetical protein
MTTAQPSGLFYITEGKTALRAFQGLLAIYCLLTFPTHFKETG